MKRLMFLALLVLPTVSARADSVPQWGRWELALTATASVSPETDLRVELTSPSGNLRSLWGYWDGGSTWRVRFMPDEAGRWNYRTYSEPAANGLNGMTGEFLCRRETSDNRFLQHGAIHVSANGRYFEHADGTPFLWIGDTAWYGPGLSHKDDWETYLKDRTAKKFTEVHFNLVAPRNGMPEDENGEISFITGKEHIRINPRFYQRLDERVDSVTAHGLLAGLVLTWGLRDVDSGNSLPEVELIRLIRYLVARYGANHVVWILTGDNEYLGESAERWKRVGRAVFGEQLHAPVTTHPGGMWWPWERLRYEPWLDFLIYQSGHGDDAKTLEWIHSGPPHLHWAELPARPMINIEPPYEGHLGYQSRIPHSPYDTRRAIYWSLLNAPTAGVTYGAHGVWSWHTAVGQPPTDHPSTGVAKTWKEALPFPGSTQMKYVAEFFTSIPWWTLQPDDNLLVEQPGEADPSRHVSAARSEKGDLAVIYLPVGGAVRLKTGVMLKDLRSEWFDPRTGRKSPAQEEGPGTYHSPEEQDWVLLLQKKSP